MHSLPTLRWYVWMFSFKPFLQSRYVAVATRSLGAVHFIATFATTTRTLQALRTENTL
jgi:hypothetical protein